MKVRVFRLPAHEPFARPRVKVAYQQLHVFLKLVASVQEVRKTLQLQRKTNKNAQGVTFCGRHKYKWTETKGPTKWPIRNECPHPKQAVLLGKPSVGYRLTDYTLIGMLVMVNRLLNTMPKASSSSSLYLTSNAPFA